MAREHAEQRTELSRIRALQAPLQEELEALRASRQQWTAERGRLISEAERLQKEQEALRADNVALKANQTSYESRLADLQKQGEQLGALHAHVTEQTTKLAAEWSTRREALAADNQRLTSEIGQVRSGRRRYGRCRTQSKRCAAPPASSASRRSRVIISPHSSTPSRALLRSCSMRRAIAPPATSGRSFCSTSKTAEPTWPITCATSRPGRKTRAGQGKRPTPQRRSRPRILPRRPCWWRPRIHHCVSASNHFSVEMATRSSSQAMARKPWKWLPGFSPWP